MIAVQFANVSFGYPGNPLLEDISFQIKDRCRAGIIGPNGAGKTTLIRLMLKAIEPDRGEIMFARDLRIGVLEQMPGHIPATPVGELLEAPFEPLKKMEVQIRDLENRMSMTQDDQLHDRYDQLTAQFRLSGGFSYQSKIQEVVAGLGISRPDGSRGLNSFSGGEQSRLMLARLLLESPHLMLLDEPTNHLDIQAVEWLESFLKDYQGAVVVISHDRYFLDRVVNEIFELSHRRLHYYPGNYSEFTVQKKLRAEQQAKQFYLQQEQIRKMEEFIRRNMAAQKTKQAQSRQKALQKMERIEAPEHDGRSMKLRIETPHVGGRIVVELEDLGMRFDDKPLFSNVNLKLERGRIAGVIGANGCGKTTFLKILGGVLAPGTGEIRFGYKIQHITYDQKLDDLNPSNNLIEEIRTLRPWMTDFEVRSHLGAFLFSGDDVFKAVGQLSGGEKARLSLAKLVLNKANLLLLDEPTNHLDLDSREVLEEAILEYPGTIIMVTHDRYLLDRAADVIWAFEEGSIHEYPGNYNDYRMAKEKVKALPPPADTGTITGRSSRKDLRKAKADIRSRTGKSSRYYEVEIGKIEKELDAIHTEMKNPALAVDWVALDALAERDKALKKHLEELMTAWERAVNEEKQLEQTRDQK